MGNIQVGSQRQEEPRCVFWNELVKFTESLAIKNKPDGKIKVADFEEYFCWRKSGKLGHLFFNHVSDHMEALGTKDLVRRLEKFIDQCSSAQGKFQEYSKLLTNRKPVLGDQDLREIFYTCWEFASCQSLDHSQQGVSEGSPVIAALASSALDGQEGISCEQFISWASSYVSSMFGSLHQWLMGRIMNGGSAQPQVLPCCSWSHDSIVLLSPDTVWLLSMVLPGCYLGNQHALPTAAPSDDQEVPVWTLLYDCVEHGQSLNRFKHHCFSYRGPTLFIVRVMSGQVFVMAIDTEWRESSSSWGKTDCVMVYVQPQLQVLQGGANMVFFNERTRGRPTGIVLGPLANPWAVIDTDLSSVRLQGDSDTQTITKLEVWGCGGEKAKEFQKKQQQWERAQAEKSRKVKLPGKWDDNPDKAILEMAGIRTNYSQR